MTFTLPSNLFHIEEEDDQYGNCSRSESQEPATGMRLIDVSYDRIREASLAELYHISEQARIGDDLRLSGSKDMRERLILMKRKLEGNSNIWKPLFKSVKEETKVKIDSLVQLMATVEDTFRTIPSEPLSEILRKEGHLQGRNLIEELSYRIENLKEKRSLVVVAGETNGGKSTFLNLLLGEDILPTYVLHCTFAVCKIVYSDVYSIKTLDHDDVEEHFPCSTREEVQAILRNKVTRPETRDREFESSIKEITLGLPADILKSGVVLVDTPGIGENEVLDNVTMNFVKSTNASAFIYIIKSDTAGGVQEDRLIGFLRAIKDRYTSDAMVEAFDPRAAMFVCHRWDAIDEKHREKVKQNAISKLEYVWPGFDASQTYFFSTKDTNKHLPVDPEFVTDSFMVLLKGLKQLFDRACHNAIKHQYVWLKYMLHPAFHHLKSMITNCIMSNEQLEEYFSSVADKQNKLMISSTENSSKLQMRLKRMSLKLKELISNHLSFDFIRASQEIMDSEEIIQSCSKDNFLASQENRQALDEMIVRSLLKHVDDSSHLQEAVREMESIILHDIQHHLGLFKCQISQIKHNMLHGVSPTVSPRQSTAGLEESSKSLGRSTDSLVFTDLPSSDLDAFHGLHTQEPSQLSDTVKNLLLRRKEDKSTKRTTANYKNRQPLLGRIRDQIKQAVFHKTDPAAYVEDRMQKVSRDIRNDEEIMDSVVNGYTEWIQQCMSQAVNSIPHFIEVNTKLMEQIRDHRTMFQRNKDVFVKAMENLEPCRHNLRGYGLLYMDDINAEAVTFNTEHRTSIVSLPRYLYTASGRNIEAGFQESAHDCLWTRVEAATIEIDNVASRVAIKTYTRDFDERAILPEIASLRFLDCNNLAPFLGMTRIAARSSKYETPNASGSEDVLPQKVSAFIFKGDLVSARVYFKRKVNRQKLPKIMTSLLQGLNYIHREGLVHMELNLKTVMVENETGTVKLCHMCKPREATFPDNLDVPTHSHVCLSPSVLEGNLYESTDDIYAFGLLLWESLFPDKPPFKEQRLWPLKKFIHKCRPSNMLQDDLEDLQASKCVKEVLKGTLLISRGQVSMSVATIQSLLEDLEIEPAVLCMSCRPDKSDANMNSSTTVPAPEVTVNTPSGTGMKLQFTYDSLCDQPKGSSIFPPIESTSVRYSSSEKLTSVRYSSSEKLTSVHKEQNDKKRATLSQTKATLSPAMAAKRRTSEPDITQIEPPATQPKKKTLQFLSWFKIGHAKKKLAENVKPPEAGDTIARKGKRPVKTENVKPDSGEIQTSPTQLRPKNKSKEMVKEKPIDVIRQDKHNSLPSQSFFGPRSSILTRKDSFDVPALMSSKFRQTLGNKTQPGTIASRSDPLSSLKYESYQSGSMPCLLCLTESHEHDSAEPLWKQSSDRVIVTSTNARTQTQTSSTVNSRTNELIIPPDASSFSKPVQRLGGSLYDLPNDSDAVKHAAHSRKCISSEKVSTSDLNDKNTESILVRKSRVTPKRKVGSWQPHHPSPLALTRQDVTPLPADPSDSSTTVPDNMEIAEIKSNLLSSSTNSSKGADSGFSTDASVGEVKDYLGSYDDLPQSTSSVNGAALITRNVNDDTDKNFPYTGCQKLQASCLVTNNEQGKSSIDNIYSNDTRNNSGRSRDFNLSMNRYRDDTENKTVKSSDIDFSVGSYRDDTENYTDRSSDIDFSVGSYRDDTENYTDRSSDFNFSVYSNQENTENGNENYKGSTKDFSTQNLTGDSEGTLDNCFYSQRNETLCESRNIPPPPPPINFDKLSFKVGDYDEDSD